MTEFSKDLLIQQSIAQLQADTAKLNPYLRNSMAILAELWGNDVNTATEILAPLQKFLTAIDKTDAVKAEERIWTVAKNYNFINNEEVKKYADYVELLATKWDARFTAAATNPINLQALTAELHADIDLMLFQDAKVFQAIVWYVEAIGYASIITDAATWIKPFEDLFAEIQALVDTWDETRKIRITAIDTDFINYQTLQAGADAVAGVLTREAEAVIAVRDEGGAVIPDTWTINCTGAGTGTCDLLTDGTGEFTEATCGGTDFSTCTALRTTQAEKDAKKAAEAEAIQKEVEKIEAEKEAKELAEAAAKAEAEAKEVTEVETTTEEN